VLSAHENEPRMAKLVRGYSGDVRKAFVALAGVSPSPRAGDCLSAGVGVRFVLAIFHLPLIGSGRVAGAAGGARRSPGPHARPSAGFPALHIF